MDMIIPITANHFLFNFFSFDSLRPINPRIKEIININKLKYELKRPNGITKNLDMPKIISIIGKKAIIIDAITNLE